MKLIKLKLKHKHLLIEMIEEWEEDQKKNNTDTSPYAIFKNDCHKYFYYLKHLDNKSTKNGFVPSSVYFLYDEMRNKLIGAVDIRHYLNENLMQTGGHIGDGIRPSERRKGYGTLIIKLALEKCKELGIDKVLMFCDKSNIGSKKTIERNGGIFEQEVKEKNGNTLLKYWIPLK